MNPLLYWDVIPFHVDGILARVRRRSSRTDASKTTLKLSFITSFRRKVIPTVQVSRRRFYTHLVHRSRPAPWQGHPDARNGSGPRRKSTS
jgi:hypothetical protein